MNTQTSETQGDQWISAHDAALLLGISARAVQKRCAAGKMTARRISTSQGVRWELDAHELRRELTNEQGANHANQRREPGSFDAQKDANPRTKGREPDANQLRGELARERELNGFLRGLIEQHQRSEAELRAALREALKAQPRQLTSGASSTKRQDAFVDEAQNGAGTMKPAKCNGQPLTIGDIADELERSLNR